MKTHVTALVDSFVEFPLCGVVLALCGTAPVSFPIWFTDVLYHLIVMLGICAVL